MSFSPSPMLLVGTLVAAAIVGAVTPANAAPAQVSDAAYLTVSRCAGLAEGMGRDAKPLKALMTRASVAREAYIYDRAEDTRANAVIEARRAGEDTRRHLNAEIEGSCAALASQSAVVAGR